MALLEITDLHARYRIAPILQGVSITVEAGEIVSIFGRNGAGKTTLLKTAMGWLAPTAGTIALEGRSIAGVSPDRIFRRGIAFIPEDRRIFARLSVLENLELGLFAELGLARAERRRRMARVFDLFPRLAERRNQAGRTLSGGEQQMLAIGRALVGAPKLLLVDEPSEGLAPKVVAEIFAALAGLRAENIALLLVEQNVQRAAAISERCYVMEKGCIVAQGKLDILKHEAVRRALSV